MYIVYPPDKKPKLSDNCCGRLVRIITSVSHYEGFRLYNVPDTLLLLIITHYIT